MDPSSLPVDSPWKALGLPTPEVATISTSATTRRVVLLGAPGSGKRSLCQRLCAAAEAEGKVAVDHDGEGMQPGDSEATTTAAQLPLFTPPKVGDAANLLMSTIADAATPLPASTEVEPSAAGKRRLYRGCGVAHCYISQRLPSVDGVGPGVSSLTHGSAGATTRRRVVEFFCCDSVGALAAALPTPQTLEEAVLLVVVDVSEVASIKSQLDRYLGAVQAYVKGMLRTALPTRGDVRYVQLVEAQQERWATADSSAGDLRRTLYDRKQRELGELFADASVKTENLMLSPVPVVETGVLPLQTIVVCTKTDLLPAESSEILGRDDDVNGPEGSAAGAKVPSPFRTAATRMKLSILALVGQLIRHYAITHRCALAAVSARIMDSSESTSPNAAAHLFIKSFWAYLSSLMEGCGADHGLSVVASQSCTAGFFPFAFLPFGLDTYHVLHNDVNSLAVVFPEQLAPTSDGEPDDAFKLHREYLLDFERAMKAADPRATGETAQEEKMLWDD